MQNTQTTTQPKVHLVNSRNNIKDSIRAAKSGDTIVLTTDGNYGHIRITNKTGIRIKSHNKRLLIEASFTLDGNSSHIIIENINLWSANQKKQPLITLGSRTNDIIIRHCIISSFPVSMNHLREKFEGSSDSWGNGIEISGENCQFINNICVNLKNPVHASGHGTLIQNNVIQYFSGHAIQARNHEILILQNHIYDAITSETADITATHLEHESELTLNPMAPAPTSNKIAIYLIPPKDKATAGEIQGIEIIGNTIRSHSRGTSVPKNRQDILEGIVGKDGYFKNISIVENAMVLNSDSGISLNGAHKLILFNNKVISTPREDGHTPTPGIKLYLTRTSTPHANNYEWLTDKPYSVHYESNNAPLFNLPVDYYDEKNTGDNRFTLITHDLTQGDDAVIIRPKKATSLSVPPPLPSATRADKPEPRMAARESSGHVHQVKTAEELKQAIQGAEPQDTIIITHRGNYGDVHITNKSQLRIQSINTDIPIQATFVIDGTSHNIVLENMQIWNSDLSKRQLIITGRTTASISIRNCVLSTVRINRNTMRNHYSGQPDAWINGIRMLGSNGQIINNYLINLKLSIAETGLNTLVKHNLIQFFSEDAIRVSNHGVRVFHNHIYDSVATHPGNNAHKDAIQLIPPTQRYNGGSLNNVQIVGNVIQSSTAFAVPDNERGVVQGIFGSDGYFVNTIITGNTIAVNSDHGITLNGVKNARINNNRILDLTPSDNFNPGIKLYLTRISESGQQSWLANRSYSVQLSSNQAPILNTPSEAYDLHDSGNNRFQSFSHDLARGIHPVIIRSNQITTDPVILDTPNAPSNQSKGQVYSITSQAELHRAINVATQGDTLLLKKSGNYGVIRLSNKKNLRLKASSRNLIINAHILIDGNSQNIFVENMTLWFSESNWKPVILTAPTTRNITIRNCLISSTPITRGAASDGISGNPSLWVSGMWLRGTNNKIIDNRIVNVSVGINASGEHTHIQNNLIQYYSEVGIRAFNHHIDIIHNNIYDAIRRKPDSRRRNTGIQLIPPKNRFSGGELNKIRIANNVIQVKNSGTSVPTALRGRLQGITGLDGYMRHISIISNTLVVNTEHGIVLNGVANLSLNNNRVFDASPQDYAIPGIRLYYTRTIDINGDHKQTWHTNQSYSVIYGNNRAPVLNIPSAHYQSTDIGDNDFGVITDNAGSGINPDIEA